MLTILQPGCMSHYKSCTWRLFKVFKKALGFGGWFDSILADDVQTLLKHIRVGSDCCIGISQTRQ